ncbi:MAG: S-layer homology domain-containing protein, partial [Armatimonadetes bacterium]|nr:S-layer homology domain-containing protein [Armatimonadota bacterium]
PWSLPTANANLQAGDTAIMRGGDYPAGDNIAPVNSGTPIAPIVYQAATGETPRIYRPEGRVYLGANLEYKSYITLDGITFQYCTYWIRGTESTGLTITNCTFLDSNEWESARFRNMGDYLYIGNCSFTNGTDNLTIQGGNYHLIERNVFNTASHTLLVFMGVQHSVVRGNLFINPIQKCQEVFTTRAVHWPYAEQRKSEYLVIEDNEYALASGPHHNWAGIQWAGNNSVVRRNVFHDCGVALDITSYPDDEEEAWYDEHNRFCHNTFYKNGYLLDAVGLYLGRWSAAPAYGDHEFVNNLFYLNESTREDTSASDQVCFGWTTGISDGRFHFNDLFYTAAGQDLFGSQSLGINWTLAEFEAAYPATAADNLEAHPQMVDPAGGDFTLQATSPCIDAGGPLTHTTASGSGTVIPVADALYFSDGKGIVAADVIRVGGQPATIVHVDYAGNQLEVSASLSWASDDQVTLDYTGSGPDIGAFEYSGEVPPPAAGFQGIPSVGTAPLSVHFTDLSTGRPTSWSWDFGDGAVSLERNPTHAYAQVGTYAVSLTAANAGGESALARPHYILVAFPDVAATFWALREILACVDAGIVAGYTDGRYHPANQVTRDQMAVYISRALAGGDSSVPDFAATPAFPDVPEAFWALKHIEYALDQGVVAGYGDGNYHPEYEVTRDQMAVYVARSLVAPTGEAALAEYVPADPRNFPDVPSTGYGDDGTEPFWAYKHIEYCVEHGVVAGYLDGYYRPQDVVTRDQMAVYISRAFELTL